MCDNLKFKTRLQHVVHQDQKLYLVFEFLTMDLKKHLDTTSGFLDKMLVKVQYNYALVLMDRYNPNDSGLGLKHKLNKILPAN